MSLRPCVKLSFNNKLLFEWNFTSSLAERFWSCFEMKKNWTLFSLVTACSGRSRGLRIRIDDILLLIVYNLSIIKHKMIFNGILACLFTIFMVFLESVIQSHMAEYIARGHGRKVKRTNDLLLWHSSLSPLLFTETSYERRRGVWENVPCLCH